MTDPLQPYDLLRTIVSLSNASISIESKVDQIVRSISDGLKADRCLMLDSETIRPNGFLSRIVLEKEPFWLEKGSLVSREGVLHEEEHLLCASLGCIPLFADGSFQGVLYVGFSNARVFSPQEKDLLISVAEVIGGTIRNARFQKEAERARSELNILGRSERVEACILSPELEKKVRQLSTLWELNKALLTTVNFERIVQMTLTAITLGDGLAFNRAMLFLVNSKRNGLEGTMAVGPDSPEEAGRIWTALSQRKNGSLSDQVVQLQSPLDQKSVLNAIVREIEIPFDKDQCILVRTVIERKPFNVCYPQPDKIESQNICARGCALSTEVGCSVGERLGRDPRVYSFATVPLWGKREVIGVIVVDNLYNRTPIREEDLQLLTMFSNQAGLAIENTLLYRNLEDVHQELKGLQAFITHREKMAALGEFSNNIAHEIKNPLVSIGGFARRLYRALPEEAPEKRYTQAIMIEVGRVERILGEILTYTRDESASIQEFDLRAVLEESLSMASEEINDEGIQVVREYSEGLPRVRGDYHQLKQAFFNLITSARQAMNGKGILSIRAFPISRNDSSFIRVEIQNSGKGFDPESLHNIFNPFYSTTESGLGFSLPIVHKIITSHRGQIEVDNRPGKGTTFIITLPIHEGEEVGPNRFYRKGDGGSLTSPRRWTHEENHDRR